MLEYIYKIMKKSIKKNDNCISIPLLMLLGIDEESATTLFTLITQKPDSVKELSHMRNLSRTTIYTHLGTLTESGLIAENQLILSSIDLQHILARIETALYPAQEELRQTIIQSSMESKPETHVRNDSQAIASVFDDIATTLPKNGTYFRYTSRQTDEKPGHLYTELRKKKEFERLVITSAEKASTKKADPNRFIKTVPKEFCFDDNVSLVIYGDKIAHLDHTTGTTITITSKSLARFQEKIFKILWRKL